MSRFHHVVFALIRDPGTAKEQIHLERHPMVDLEDTLAAYREVLEASGEPYRLEVYLQSEGW